MQVFDDVCFRSDDAPAASTTARPEDPHQSALSRNYTGAE